MVCDTWGEKYWLELIVLVFFFCCFFFQTVAAMLFQSVFFCFCPHFGIILKKKKRRRKRGTVDLRCIQWHTGPRTLLVFVRSFHCVQTRAVTERKKKKKRGAGQTKGGWGGARPKKDVWKVHQNHARWTCISAKDSIGGSVNVAFICASLLLSLNFVHYRVELEGSQSILASLDWDYLSSILNRNDPIRLFGSEFGATPFVPHRSGRLGKAAALAG